MNREEQVRTLWAAVARQDAETMRGFFAPDAVIRWHCTNEAFTLEEYLRANCEYPGAWEGTVERLEDCGSTVVCVARVWNGQASFHAVSFYKFQGALIVSADEYWGDDGAPPDWRREMRIGKPISN